jgi:DNA gyrase subunit A
MIINRSGITIRLEVGKIRVTGRATQGVRLINLRESDTIAAVTSVVKSPDLDENIEEVNPEVTENDVD